MSRYVRLSLIAYGLAMAAVTSWVWLQPRNGLAFSFDSRSDQWTFGGAACLALLVFAIALIFTRRADLPRPGWLLAMLGIAATAALPMFAEGFRWSDLPLMAQVIGEIVAYVAITLWLDRLLRRGMRAPARPLARNAALAACFAGACMVLSSVFLLTSFGKSSWTTGSARGWEILVGKANWVTASINVAVGLDGTDTRFSWLQPAFLVAGYAVYALCLAITLAMVVRLIAGRNSNGRGAPARFLSFLGTVLTLFCFWLYTDIFWGWHFEWDGDSIAPLIATLLWLAAPLLAAAILWPVARGRFEPWRLRAVLMLQAPIAIFNYCAMFDYFEDLKIPGLAMLLMGAQVESWACIVMLAHSHAEVPSPAVAQPA